MYGLVLFESSVILLVPALMVVVPIVQLPILPDVLVIDPVNEPDVAVIAPVMVAFVAVSAPALVTLKGEFSPKAIPSDAK
jgi:hypothetical protein